MKVNGNKHLYFHAKKMLLCCVMIRIIIIYQDFSQYLQTTSLVSMYLYVCVHTFVSATVIGNFMQYNVCNNRITRHFSVQGRLLFLLFQNLYIFVNGACFQEFKESFQVVLHTKTLFKEKNSPHDDDTHTYMPLFRCCHHQKTAYYLRLCVCRWRDDHKMRQCCLSGWL